MKMMPCPINGLRNINEFVHGGEVRALPDINHCTPEQWGEYVFFHDNTVRIVREWWLHTPSGYWFIAERHMQTDEIIRTYDPSEIFQERIDYNAQAQG